MSGAVKTERQRFGGELTPEIIPLVPALEAKEFLIEGTGPANVFRVIHHEIERPNRNCSPRDEIFFFLMVLLCNCGLQFRQQRRPPPKLRSESFDCA